jgi:hypothetical protein
MWRQRGICGAGAPHMQGVRGRRHLRAWAAAQPVQGVRGRQWSRDYRVEATAVEVFEDEEEPHEWIPTVQGHLVVAAGLRGGKRKRTGAMTSDGDFRRPTWLPAQSGNTGRSDPLSLACVVLCVHTLSCVPAWCLIAAEARAQ